MTKQTKEQKVKSYLLKFKKNLWEDRIRNFLEENQKDLYWGAAEINFFGETVNSFDISDIYPKEDGKLLDAYKLPVESTFTDFYEKEGFLSFHIFNPSPYEKKEIWECYPRDFSGKYNYILNDTSCNYLDNNSDWKYHEEKYNKRYYYIGKSYERTIDIPLETVVTDEDDNLAYQNLKENHSDWLIA